MSVLHNSKPIGALIGIEEYVSTDQVQVAEVLIPLIHRSPFSKYDIEEMSLRTLLLLMRKFGRFSEDLLMVTYTRKNGRPLSEKRAYLKEAKFIKPGSYKLKPYGSSVFSYYIASSFGHAYDLEEVLVLAHVDTFKSPTIEDIQNHCKTF